MKIVWRGEIDGGTAVGIEPSEPKDFVFPTVKRMIAESKKGGISPEVVEIYKKYARRHVLARQLCKAGRPEAAAAIFSPGRSSPDVG